MVDRWSTQSIWEASLIAYLYGFDTLEKIIDHQEGNRAGDKKWVTEYAFGVNSEDAKADIEKYNSEEGVPLASARAFVHSFNLISQTQRTFRRRGETSWVSTRWIEGK